MATLQEGFGSKESHQIIAADKVEGTAVYTMAGDKVGTIRTLMIDKLSGKVVFATMATGGVLGIGATYHALPWNVLTYNTDLDGYQLDVDREGLEAGPAATEEELIQNLQNKGWEAPSFGPTGRPGGGPRD